MGAFYFFTFGPQVWRLYRSNRLVDAVDPCLRDEFPTREASCVLQIGLLCTQASAALRPSMAQVVHFLTNNDCEIPPPNQPPYMNTSLLETENSRWSYSINSLVSNGPTEVEASSTSMESSSMHSSNGQIRSEESSAWAAPRKIPRISHTLAWSIITSVFPFSMSSQDLALKILTWRFIVDFKSIKSSC